MEKCCKCGNKFVMPKGRKVCYLCEECRMIAIHSDDRYSETETIDLGNNSFWTFYLNVDVDGDNE